MARPTRDIDSERDNIAHKALWLLLHYPNEVLRRALEGDVAHARKDFLANVNDPNHFPVTVHQRRYLAEMFRDVTPLSLSQPTGAQGRHSVRIPDAQPRRNSQPRRVNDNKQLEAKVRRLEENVSAVKRHR